MSFQIAIETDYIPQSIARQLCDKINENHEFRLLLIKKHKYNKTLFSVYPAELLISDNHDPDELILITNIDKLDPMCSLVEDVFNEIHRNMTLLFGWNINKWVDDQNVTIQEINSIIKENKIRNKVKYYIQQTL
jgi:hypothetical protein